MAHNGNDRPAEGLRRVIGVWQATAMVAGTIIGASIFVQPSEITGRIPSVGGIFAVWAVAGLLTLFGAMVCAELASTFGGSGGVYRFLTETYSPAVGFLWGWAMFWSMHSGIIAAIATVFVRYLAYFVPLGSLAAKAVATVLILVLSAINYLGVRQGSALQTTFTAGKVAAIAIIVVAGFALGPASPQEAAPTTPPPVSSSSTEFGLALVAGLFAFGGWHMVTYNAEETVAPERTIPRALILGTAIVTLAYMALNAVYLHVLPLSAVASSTRVAADAADAVLGSGGGTFMAALVMFSTFGALSGIVLTGPRVYYAMARDGLLFRWLGRPHPRFRTPHRAIAIQAVWSSLLVWTGTYRALFTRVVYTEWIFFGMLALGLILLRRRRDLRRSWTIPGHPWIPLLFALSSFAIVINQIVSDPSESFWGLGLVLAGLPIYFLWGRTEAAGRTTSA